ncbi:hypothetical protein [Halocatena halophila]|uniref:hypothetical protein n=1 Tax=Halocatena halophila TaxID=2814576 RepID=UPI002ED6956C
MTRSKPLIAVSMLVVVLLAGCSGFTPTGDDIRVTPAPVPEEGPANQIAPGVTNETIVDGNQLVHAHRSVLNESPVRITHHTKYAFENETTPQRQNTSTVFSANGSIGYSKTGLVENKSLEQWIEDGRSLQKRAHANGSVEFHERPAMERQRFRMIGTLNKTLSRTGNETIKPIDESSNRTLYRINATIMYATEENNVSGETQSATIQCVIDDRGFIRNATVRNPELGSTGIYTATITYERADTPPTQPEWVPDAREQIDNRTDE